MEFKNICFPPALSTNPVKKIQKINVTRALLETKTGIKRSTLMPLSTYSNFLKGIKTFIVLYWNSKNNIYTTKLLIRNDTCLR